MLPEKTINKVKLWAAEESSRDYAMFISYDEGGTRASELVYI